MYPPFPPAFQLGTLTIRWYGIILVGALIIGALVASRYVAQRGQDRENIWNLALWIVVPAVFGARLYALFLQLPPGAHGSGYYIGHPLTILAVWQGGLHLYGALLGGGIALLAYLSIKKLPVPLYLDALALALLVCQIIGRLGSFFDQAWYGPPTTASWGVLIDPAYRVEPYNDLALYPAGQHFQPLFLYEMSWNVAGLLLLWLLSHSRKSMRAGDLALIYLIWYPTGRFVLECARTDVIFFPGTHLDSVHLISAIVVIVCATWLLRRHRRLAHLLATPLLLGMEPSRARVAYQYATSEEDMGGGEYEEYEGMEDLDEWRGEHFSVEDLYDEGEEHLYERGFLGLHWSIRKRKDEEGEEVFEEEDEEGEEVEYDDVEEVEEVEDNEGGEYEEGAEEEEEEAEDEEESEEVVDDEESASEGEADGYEEEEATEYYEEAADEEAEETEGEAADEYFAEAEDDADDSSDDSGDDAGDGDAGDGGDE